MREFRYGAMRGHRFRHNAYQPLNRGQQLCGTTPLLIDALPHNFAQSGEYRRQRRCPDQVIALVAFGHRGAYITRPEEKPPIEGPARV